MSAISLSSQAERKKMGGENGMDIHTVGQTTKALWKEREREVRDSSTKNYSQTERHSANGEREEENRFPSSPIHPSLFSCQQLRQ